MEVGGKHSEETKAKIRNSCLNREFPIVDKTNVIIAIHERCDKPCINITTGIEYESISEASRQLKISIPQISRVCNGDRLMTHNFIFRFKDYEKNGYIL